MEKFAPERYEKGVWLSLTISNAAIELDCAQQSRPIGYQNTNTIKTLLQKHYQESKSKNALGYSGDMPMISTLGYDVIPKIFNITKENCKKYELRDYLAGLELILEQFQDIEKAEPDRLDFLRKFLIDLGNYRLGRLESPEASLAA